jgi:NADH-quinone oxidoreductase subunit M
VLTLVFGFYPKPVLDMSQASVTSLIDIYQRGLAGPKTADAAPRVGVQK